MASGARYAIVPNSDDWVTFGTPGDSDHLYQHIQAPGIIQSSDAVLFYKLRPSGTQQLRIKINGIDVLQTILVEGDLRTLHEIIPGTILKESDNEILFSVVVEPGRVTLSDIDILYSATL